MKTEVRLITPLVASEMLKKNSKNRSLNDSHCNYLTQQMNSGQWLFDGQPIRFSNSGTLLDGQHRLNAVVKSGKTIEFLIVTGIESSAFKVMDTGKNRNGADCLSILGVEYSAEVSACARMVINYNKKRYSNESGSNKVTNTDLLDWYKKNNAIIDKIRFSENLTKEFSRVLSKSYLASLLHLFSEKNVIQAENFIRKMCTGLDLELDSPIYVLRKRLILDKMNKAKLPSSEKMALIIKAWNNYRLNNSVKFLRWNKASEDFPIIK